MCNGKNSNADTWKIILIIIMVHSLLKMSWAFCFVCVKKSATENGVGKNLRMKKEWWKRKCSSHLNTLYQATTAIHHVVSFGGDCFFCFCFLLGFFFWFVFSCFLSFLKDRKELIRRKRNGREGAAQRRLLVYEVVIIHSELSFPNDSSNKQILSMWRMVSSGRIKKSGFGLTFFFSFFFSHHFEDYLLACRNWMY